MQHHPAIDRLSLVEKAQILSGESFWTTRSIPHVDIEGATLTDGPHGIRFQDPSGGVDHLGIAISVPATAFPTAAALGSSWDPQLLERVGAALGVECRALGVDILLGPGVNMKRSPLCGRNFEYFSEDPLHSGALGAAWVKGLQAQGVGASVKHFAANNQETNRLKVSAEVDERTLRETYLPAFERIVKDANPATMMCSYNKINGVLASQHQWLLTDVLRHDWSFAGYVVSDWGAVADPIAAVAAGMDLEMPPKGDGSPRAIVEAVQEGRLSEDTVNAAVSRILTTHDRIRRSRVDVPAPDFSAHHLLARRAAAAGSVLLKNTNDVLPLDPERGGTIAVLGEFARTPRYQGAGSSHINPSRLDDALTAISAATTRTVHFAAGYRLDGTLEPALVEEATRLAEKADVAVLFLGLPDDDESEGFDRTTLDLPTGQLALVEAVAAIGVPVVVVLSNGGVVDLGPLVDDSSAILEMWLAGQASGAAAADMLFGLTEPGGRLAETIPLKLADTPAYLNWPGSYDKVQYGERMYIGYRWYDAREMDVRFPFGHGLGYTRFEYADLEVSVPDATEPNVRVTFTLANVGSRPGAEVAQLYVSSPEVEVDRPRRELRAFVKVQLEPGEKRMVTFDLGSRDFAYWGTDGWTVEPGEYILAVGASSRRLPLRTSVQLDVPAILRPLTGDSTIEEWLAHPIGEPLMRAMFASMADGSPVPATDEVFKMASGMPLRSFLAFGGGDPDDAIAPLMNALRAST